MTVTEFNELVLTYTLSHASVGALNRKVSLAEVAQTLAFLGPLLIFTLVSIIILL